MIRMFPTLPIVPKPPTPEEYREMYRRRLAFKAWKKLLSMKEDPELLAQMAVAHADALLAELEKETSK